MEWHPTVWMHPSQVTRGMRLARAVMKPVGPDGSEVRCTVWTAVWDVAAGVDAWSPHCGKLFAFRLRTGEVVHTAAGDCLPIDPEILPENLPPHEGMWITNEPFGFDCDRPWAPPYEVYAGSRVLGTWTAVDGRVYRLLEYAERCYFVCRWGHGRKWIGPMQYSRELAGAQWTAIVSGQGW